MRKPEFRYTGIDGTALITQTDVKDLKRTLFWAAYAVAENRFSGEPGCGYLKLQCGRN